MTEKITIPPDKLKKIKKEFENNNEILQTLSDKFGYSLSVIRRHLLEEGVEMRPPGYQPPNISPELIARYQSDEFSLQDLVNASGIRKEAARRALIRMGIPRHPQGYHLD